MQCSVNIPEDLKEKVENDAKNLTRSFSQQVTHIIKEYYNLIELDFIREPKQADPSEVLNKKDDSSD